MTFGSVETLSRALLVTLNCEADFLGGNDESRNEFTL
jgi:hypothetical protein